MIAEHGVATKPDRDAKIDLGPTLDVEKWLSTWDETLEHRL